MDIIMQGIDILLHVDKYLSVVIQNYGVATYVILFCIIFAETGFVVTPFLPGDSLLFAAGAFAAIGAFDVKLLLLIISSAAILGDLVNYSIGKTIGHKIYEQENPRFIKKEHLIKTRHFYEKYGAATIIIARFVPIIRTFAPFVAGVGEMHYTKFISYNVIGGLLWAFIFILGGYYFGNLPMVQQNFSLVVMAIIIISVMPVIIGFIKERRKPNNSEA